MAVSHSEKNGPRETRKLNQPRDSGKSLQQKHPKRKKVHTQGRRDTEKKKDDRKTQESFRSKA